MDRRKARTSVETALLSFSVPGSSSASGSIAWTSARLQNKACSRSSNHHLNIYQSIITSNSLPFFFLSHFLSHTDCINQGLDQEEVVTGVQNEKGCTTAAGPDRQWRDTCSLVIKSQLNLSASCTCLCPCLQRF